MCGLEHPFPLGFGCGSGSHVGLIERFRELPCMMCNSRVNFATGSVNYATCALKSAVTGFLFRGDDVAFLELRGLGETKGFKLCTMLYLADMHTVGHAVKQRF